MSKFHGPEYAITPELMTKHDLELYLNYMEGQQYNPKDVPKVSNWFFFKKFERVAESMRRYQIPRTLLKLAYERPVLTGEGPKKSLTVMDLLGHYDALSRVASANNIAKNKIEAHLVQSFDNNFDLLPKLNKEYDFAGNKILAATVALRIEAPYAQIN